MSEPVTDRSAEAYGERDRRQPRAYPDQGAVGTEDQSEGPKLLGANCRSHEAAEPEVGETGKALVEEAPAGSTADRATPEPSGSRAEAGLRPVRRRRRGLAVHLRPGPPILRRRQERHATTGHPPHGRRA